MAHSAIFLRFSIENSKKYVHPTTGKHAYGPGVGFSIAPYKKRKQNPEEKHLTEVGSRQDFMR